MPVIKLAQTPERLLEDSPEAYYWAGLIAADGSLSRKNRLLRLRLNDIEHIRMFGEFVGWRGRTQVSNDERTHGIAFMDSLVVPLFSEKFGLVHRKTYVPPPSLPEGDHDLVFSFLIGLVDGDGCIKLQSGLSKGTPRKGAVLTIKCHASWQAILSEAYSLLSGKPDLTAIINAKGFASFQITEHKILKAIHRRAEALKLPLMTRKWSRINHDYYSLMETFPERVKAAQLLLDGGMSKMQTAKALGLSPAAISEMIRKKQITAYHRYDRK